METQVRLNEAAQQMGVSRWTVRRWSQNRHYGCPPIVPLSINISVLDRIEWEAFKRRLLRGEGCSCGGYAECGGPLTGAALRRAARTRGYRLHKRGNGWRIVDANTGLVECGERFDLTPTDVDAFLQQVAS